MAEIGIYLHIPFCSNLCHYCDFAKTANWTEAHAKTYIDALGSELRSWLQWMKQLDDPTLEIATVYFGGGTPGLFTDTYQEIFEILGPALSGNPEISLEANPGNISAASLETWRGLGFSRISLGVQTFDAAGLSFLRRDHGPEAAKRAVEACLGTFDSVNLDMIYGLPGQSAEQWRADLSEALALGPQHLSLYNLIYEPGTPIGRRNQRGALEALDDEDEELFYHLARTRLHESGFQHDEVSNWSRPGHSCKHNLLYWSGGWYIGIGAGAHGYLPLPQPIGTRYSYDRSDRVFVRSPSLTFERRTTEDWLTEYVGCGLRCRYGIDLELAERVSGLTFSPNRTISMAIADARADITDRRLRLSPREWFREVYWCLEVLDSFKKATQKRADDHR